MNVLVIHDGAKILVWLVGEAVESAPIHIENGYQKLLPAWEAGTLTACELEVADGDEYRPELYEVVGGVLGRKA